MNPSQIAAQVEGSVAYGLSATLYGEMIVDKGRMTNLNFDSYEIMRLAEMPKVETVIVPTYDFWGGVGEPTICVVGAGGAERDLCRDRQAGAQPAAEEREAGVAFGGAANAVRSTLSPLREQGLVTTSGSLTRQPSTLQHHARAALPCAAGRRSRSPPSRVAAGMRTR